MTYNEKQTKLKQSYLLCGTKEKGKTVEAFILPNLELLY